MFRKRLRSSLAGTILVALAIVGEARGQNLVVASPLVVFSAMAGGANPPSQVDSVAGTRTASLSWNVANSNRLRRWLSVAPPNGVTPGALTFSVTITGLPPGRYQDTVDVISSDPADSVRSVIVVLALRSAGSFQTAGPAVGSAAGSKYLATYQVELEFIGYTGLAEGAPDCKASPLGYDRLVGTVTGVESPAPDEDVVYVGTVRRVTQIDFCETKGKSKPTDDERVWCVASLTGTAVMDVELTVYGEEGRGAYLKADAAPGPIDSHVGGQCDPAETSEIHSDYPGAQDGGGASPNGQPIDDPGSALFAAGLARLRVGFYPAQGPQGGWALRVVRKVP